MTYAIPTEESKRRMHRRNAFKRAAIIALTAPISVPLILAGKAYERRLEREEQNKNAPAP